MMKSAITKLTILSFSFIYFSCQKDNVKLPTVTTSPITEVTWDYAIAGGEVINDGGSLVIARGICATTNDINPPTMIDSFDTWHTSDSTGIGSFTSKIDIHWAGAAHNIKQTHYIRAYATNKTGTAYGKILSFSPKSKLPSFQSISLISVTNSIAIIKYDIGGQTPNFSIDKVAFCFSTSPSPTIEENHVFFTPNWDTFKDTIKNLLPNTTYYVRGYVKNESGDAYSPEIILTTWEGTISDISGNVYPYKTIGSQVWMAENLKTSKLNDGTIIPNIPDNLAWSSTTTNASCTYTNYGNLYNYYAVVDNRNLCPTGWHVPSDNEWKILEIQLNMTQTQADGTGFRGTDEGGKLKMSILDINIWKIPNTGATNSSGFSAQGGGYRYDNGILTNATVSGNFWTSSEFDANAAWSRFLSYNNAQIGRFSINKKYGFSVRCVKD